MMLTSADEVAILEWISLLDQAAFGVILHRATGDRIALFSSDQKSVVAIGVDFVGWLKRTPAKILPVLDQIVADYPATPEATVLAATAIRLRAVQAQLAAAGPPEDTRLAGGVPIVNRARLRQLLRTAINHTGHGEQVRVIKVRGESGLGRSHSWHLIRHVGAEGHAKAFKVDLISPTLAQQNVPFLFDHLVRHLKLSDVRIPTTDGITADTMAARFADELAGCLARAAEAWPRPLWLVFDNLDRDLAPDVKRFVALLTQACIDAHFDNCVIFLLGPDDATEPDDQYRVALTETVVGFRDTEIQDAAAYLNRLGTNRLCDQTLAARVADMTNLLATLRGRELLSQVSRKLVDLRLEVGA
jgi:hypothetical protein